jgi:hypothetical protein
MPQLGNLVLTDRAATPVNHTYTPRDIVNGVASVVESTGIPIGDNLFTASLTKTSGGRYKAVLKGTFPVVQTQTINGVSTPVVVRTTYAELTFSFADTSALQERKDALGLMASSLDPAKALINDMLTKLENIY